MTETIAYDMLGIKDGYKINAKYDIMCKMPHALVILSNVYLKTEALNKDHWQINEIAGDHMNDKTALADKLRCSVIKVEELHNVQWLKLLRYNVIENEEVVLVPPSGVNKLRPRQNGHCFADSTFKCIFLNENARILLKISVHLFLRSKLTILKHWFR